MTMQSRSKVEEILIHPSVTLTVIERGENGKLSSGKNAISSLGRVHATAAHPYTLRLRNGNSSTAIVYRVTTRNAHWWWAQGTHGILYPPKEEEVEEEYDYDNNISMSNSNNIGNKKVMHSSESGNKSIGYISMRVKEPEWIDRLHKEWSKLSQSTLSTEVMNSEEESQMQREPEETTDKITTITSSSLSSPPLPSSYISGKTTTAVDFIRIMFAELPATHPLLLNPQIMVNDITKSNFLTWWDKVMTAADAIATGTASASSNGGGSRREKRQNKKRTQQVVYTGVTVFTLPVKVAFLSEQSFWTALSVDAKRSSSDVSNKKVVLSSQKSLSFHDDDDNNNNNRQKKQKKVLIDDGINDDDDNVHDLKVGFCTVSLAIVAIICSFLAGVGMV
ncbi:uncharacterized protein TM35_000181610 [Trypanosoma theileri]|uniref:Uncharacterized protein n=1 Tax=Trypanosoma theileri TaxID=67003 RepID=A0A1X0NTR7_9TRYP|nr:uncharacterized protein TM35_000181610 [Trypanosoma theileri]ORC88104.1 hypothetical protein TM35_000181610 [Trypanosoma theileri]